MQCHNIFPACVYHCAYAVSLSAAVITAKCGLLVCAGPDGLWAGSTSLTLDFANIVLRMKGLGFNAIRLPFSFKVHFTVSCSMLACVVSHVMSAQAASHPLDLSALRLEWSYFGQDPNLSIVSYTAGKLLRQRCM